MAAQTLRCRDCQKYFLFSDDEQRFFAANGGWPPPVRCFDCRIVKKQQRAARASRLLSDAYEWEDAAR